MIALEIIRLTTGAMLFLVGGLALGALFSFDWAWLGTVTAGWLICCCWIAWLFCWMGGGE